MRVGIFTLSLALVIGGSAVGCKSAPKLPWSKTADTAPAGASTSTMAAGAPQLPSEIAKQAEGLAANDPVKITTPSTPANTAPTTPSGYPSTGAKDYLANAGAVSSPATGPTVANTVAPTKSALPYDPSAVPPPPAAMASTTPTGAQENRYGIPSADRYANAYPTTAPAEYPVTGTAPTQSTAAAPATPNAPVTSSAPFGSSPTSAGLGDRYATQGAPAESVINSGATNDSTSVQPASAVASVQPYRPGGTSSYPGTSANYEVATRPDSTSAGGDYGTTSSGTVYR